MLAFIKENPDFLIGIFVLIATVLGMQFKSMRMIIIFQLLSNALLALQCIVGGTVSTGGVVILATVQTAVSFIFNYKKIPFPLWLTLSFMAGFVAITVIGFISPSVTSSPFDLVTMVAVCFFALSIVQQRSWICRICLACNVSLWLIYDIFVLPSAALNHAIILTSIFVSVLHNDREEWKAFFRHFPRKREKKQNINKS